MAKAATMVKQAKQIAKEHAASAEQAVENVQESENKVGALMEVPERSPSMVYLGLTIASIIFSVVLFLQKKKDSAIFVGLWPPTFLGLGLFARLVGVRRK